MKDIMREITQKEMEKIIKSLKNGKTGRIDQIVNEQIKYRPETLWKQLRNNMNQILKTGKLPEK